MEHRPPTLLNVKGMGSAAPEEAAAQLRHRNIFPREPTLTRSPDHRTFALQRVQIVRLDGLKWPFRIAEVVFPGCAKNGGLNPLQKLFHVSFTKGFSQSSMGDAR